MFPLHIGNSQALPSRSRDSTLIAYGVEAEALIQEHYRIPSSDLLKDSWNSDRPANQPAFCWGVGVELAALNAMVAQDRSKSKELKRYADAITVYWNHKGPVPGFDVLPAPKPVDRYYDDNEWMVMDLTQTYELLHERKYLEWARKTLKYVLSGEDEKLGGGIYWKESAKTSKNACSNGPAAAACLAVYQFTKDKALLENAKRIYAWCLSHLQDPNDCLFWDSMRLDGHIDRAKYSYNTALMIRSGSELFRLTGNKIYADQVKAMVTGSIRHWFDPENGCIKDDGRFAFLLIESWMFAKRDVPGSFDGDNFYSLLSRPLSFAHDQTRVNGFYGHRWYRDGSATQTSHELIDQAAAERAFFLVGALKP